MSAHSSKFPLGNIPQPPLPRRRLALLWSDERGQDLVEYALLTGFMVIAVWAFFPSDIAPSISHIFSRLLSTASVLVP